MKNAVTCPRHGLFALLLLLLCAGQARAQRSPLHLSEDYSLDSLGRGELRFRLRNVDFFHDNEYEGHLADGYTLPGVRLRPTVSYQPLANLKIDLGVYLLHFWGADRYPNVCYSDMPQWQGDSHTGGFHALPFLRAQLLLSRGLNIVFGSIYGSVCHRLIEPLYNPELALSGDPESGLQILWENRWLWADTWVNWESFIFDGDYHQESFTYGLSLRLKANREGAPTHVYFPVQFLAQHEGGEINSEASDRTVKTWTNAAAGVGLVLNTGGKLIPQVTLEGMAATYRQQSGEAFPLDDGYGFYARASMDVGPVNVGVGYWWCHDFISIHGNPHYGSVSMSDESYVVDYTRMLRLHAHYAKPLARGMSFGVSVDAFASMPTKAYTPDTGWQHESSHISLSFGAYLYIDTGFLIKKFRSSAR